MTPETWHQIDVAEALHRLDAPLEGLTQAEAERRKREHGPNELTESGGRTVWHILWEQVSSTMIVILVVAGILALLFKGGDGLPIDAIAIFGIVILFVVLGVVQEYRAQQAIAALKQMSSPTVRALRDGTVVEISSRELVPGDVVQLEAGSVVPADLRFVEAVNLRVQEAALTGESEPIEKQTAILPAGETSLGDRRNMGYAGTFVTYGRGAGVVVATGMRTELGRIATLIQEVKHEPTPLQKRLDKLGKTLAVIAVAVAVLVALIGVVLEGKEVGEVLILGISIAVAIVPEGLPAVLTFTLAIGGQRMLKRKALIRKLPAVETLGSVTVICSDKTGTLTQNRMSVTRLHTLGLDVPVDPDRTDPAAPATGSDAARLLAASALCCDASGDASGQGGLGDPTEIALVVAAARHGLPKAELEARAPRVHEYAFDSDRKLMTTVHRRPEGEAWPGVADAGEPYLAFTKGAMDRLLAEATHAWEDGRAVPLDDARRQSFQDANLAMARQGQRVLGVAVRAWADVPSADDPSAVETGLTLIGLVGMIDPPRPEAKAAVAKCQTAGIRTIMITGDHPETARAIAAELGMADRDAEAVTGLELEHLDEAKLREVVRKTNVFARVSPEHKLRIVGALQANGEVVAMTGDGVNDAPALKKADIGVAMGITGTDVAKEAADMVLLDDNFATIVAAVEEGRVVYDNLRRFLMFSISGNIAKVMVVAIPPLLGMAAMLRPIQILFSNLLTDGLLGLGMGMEGAERDTMNRPPYRPDESVFSRGVGRHIAVVGIAAGLLLIGFGWWEWNQLGIPNLVDAARETKVMEWGALMFTSLAFMQLGRALSSRSFRDPVTRIPFGSNPVLLAMIALVLVFQLLAVFFPPTQPFFATVALTGAELGFAALFAAVVLIGMEALKAYERTRPAEA